MTDPTIDVREIILEKLTYAVQREISPEIVEQIRVDAAASHWFGQGMVVRLERDVWAHKVLAEEQRLPVTGRLALPEPPQEVLVELPRGFWRRLFRMKPVAGWFPVVGHAALNPPVVGTVTVRAEYFRTFPEADFDHPRLGNHVRVPKIVGPFDGRFWEA